MLLWGKIEITTGFGFSDVMEECFLRILTPHSGAITAPRKRYAYKETVTVFLFRDSY